MARFARTWLAVMAGMALLCALAAAEPYYGCGVTPSYVSGDHPKFSENERQHYVSAGQDFLRTYLRESVKRFIADSGVAMDLDPAQTAATMDVTRWYTREDSPVKTRLRVLANEDLRQYLHSGRFVPIKFEMDSDYQMLPGLQFCTRMLAPLDDLFQMELGSKIRWSESVDSRLTCTLRNSDRLYAGIALGMNVHWSEWHLEMGYNLTPDAVLMQNISLVKNF